jgi:hypothetical protein
MGSEDEDHQEIAATLSPKDQGVSFAYTPAGSGTRMTGGVSLFRSERRNQSCHPDERRGVTGKANSS